MITEQKGKTKKQVTKKKKWPAKITKESNALDLQQKVFAADDPAKIARSLKCSAEKSNRRKGTPY